MHFQSSTRFAQLPIVQTRQNARPRTTRRAMRTVAFPLQMPMANRRARTAVSSTSSPMWARTILSIICAKEKRCCIGDSEAHPAYGRMRFASSFEVGWAQSGCCAHLSLGYRSKLPTSDSFRSGLCSAAQFTFQGLVNRRSLRPRMSSARSVSRVRLRPGMSISFGSFSIQRMSV